MIFFATSDCVRANENPQEIQNRAASEKNDSLGTRSFHILQFLHTLGTLTLPPESQWEYACRAGTKTPFSFGETISPDQVNFDGNHPYGDSPKGEYREETVEVKSLSANRWGLYEMHGNVWEWCSDWYAEYSPEPQIDPTGPATGSYRVMRGGGWDYGARGVRSAFRYWFAPGDRSSDLGFRLLSSASPDRNQPPNK